MDYRIVACCLLIAGLWSCIPPSEEEYEGVVIDINDNTARRIYDLQNERRVDSLLFYLTDANPSYRFLAARAFGSFPTLNESTRDSLVAALNDPEQLVRTEAAYALGQTRNEAVTDALVAAFDPSGANAELNSTILQALGKTAGEEVLENIATISTYQLTDTVLMAGRAWSLYYYGLRGLSHPDGDRFLVDLLANPEAPAEIRRPAAYYLHRIAAKVDSVQLRQLQQQLRNETDADIAMGIIRALGRTDDPAARVALVSRYERTDDWRQRVEIIRSLAGFNYGTVRETIVEALRDPNPHLARVAADFLVDNGVEADAIYYRQLAQDSLPMPVRSRLYRAANRHLSPYLTDYRDRINYALRQAYSNSTDVYEKADLIRAIGEFPWMYRVVYDMYQAAESPVVQSAAAETLETISKRDDFAAYFRNSSRRVRYELSTYFKAMIESGEAGPAYHAAGALSDTSQIYLPYYPSLDWVTTAMESLELPREIETYNQLLGARDALSGTVSTPKPTDTAAKPIDWETVLASGTGEVLIRTEEGRITISLYPQAAPATVSSFLELVKERYYDDKVFHRVVPNFVAQGGGPRGDGFGSENFIIRTETPAMHWDRAGLIGMASAGKDTEGVQFFITHRATPHLDGNYTIFGEVTEGQDVVDRLTPGSRIESIQLR